MTAIELALDYLATFIDKTLEGSARRRARAQDAVRILRDAVVYSSRGIRAVQRPVDWATWLRGLLDVELRYLADRLGELVVDARLAESADREVACLDAMRDALAFALGRLEARTAEGLRR